MVALEVVQGGVSAEDLDDDVGELVSEAVKVFL